IHYHSTFKEILAVKYGITKFQFHLTGYHFLVEMDMSSFPKMLQFKQKEVPHSQLLRWAEWFSRFSFDVVHIKRKTNVLADTLTRLPETKPLKIPVSKPVEVFMFRPSSSKEKGKKKQQLPSPFSIPCNPNTHPEHHSEVLALILEKRFHKEAMNMMLSYQLDVFRNFGGLFLKPLGLHPKYPLINPIKFQFGEFPEELKWMFWYLTHLFHIGIEFFIHDLQHFLTLAIHNEEAPEMKNLATFLKWFYPLEYWADMLMFESLKNTRTQWVVIVFYKPQYFMQNGSATQLASLPSSWIHKTYFEEVYENPADLKQLQKYLCQLNKIIPSEIWPLGNLQAPWDVSTNPSIEKALEEYWSNIPDPKEWSQEYPKHCSQIIQETATWKDIHENPDSSNTPLATRHDMTPPDDLEKRIEQLELKCYRAREKKRQRIEELNITSDIDTDYDTEDAESLG
ncbi:hypothetical protein Gotur_021443, partial [Gossypium turneri]